MIIKTRAKNMQKFEWLLNREKKNLENLNTVVHYVHEYYLMELKVGTAFHIRDFSYDKPNDMMCWVQISMNFKIKYMLLVIYEYVFIH